MGINKYILVSMRSTQGCTHRKNPGTLDSSHSIGWKLLQQGELPKLSRNLVKSTMAFFLRLLKDPAFEAVGTVSMIISRRWSDHSNYLSQPAVKPQINERSRQTILGLDSYNWLDLECTKVVTVTLGKLGKRCLGVWLRNIECAK